MREARTDIDMIERMYMYDLISNQAILIAKGSDFGWVSFGDRADANMFYSKTIGGKYILATEDMLQADVEIIQHDE